MTSNSFQSSQPCPRCGVAFQCGMACGARECWCAALPTVVPVPGQDAAQGCWCPACLKAEIDRRSIEAGKSAAITTIASDVES